MSYARNLARIARSGAPTVDTVQDLRDMAIYGGLVPDRVVTVGAEAVGDGGGATWRWDGASTASDDGLSTALPSGRVGAGRWVVEGDRLALTTGGSMQALLDGVVARPVGRTVGRIMGQHELSEPVCIPADSGGYWDIDATAAQITVAFDGVGVDLNASGDLSDLEANIIRHATWTGGNIIAGTAGEGIGMRLVDGRDIAIDRVRWDSLAIGLQLMGRDTYHITRCYVRLCTIGIDMSDLMTDESQGNNLAVLIDSVHMSLPDIGVFIDSQFADAYITRSSFNFGGYEDKRAVVANNRFNGAPATIAASGLYIDKMHIDPMGAGSIGVDVAEDDYSGIVLNAKISDSNINVNGAGAIGVRMGNVYRAAIVDCRFHATSNIGGTQTITAIDTSTNFLTVSSHGLQTGDLVSLDATVSYPVGLTDKRYYRAVVFDADTVGLCTVWSDIDFATVADSALVDITSEGSGTITLNRHTATPLLIGPDVQHIAISNNLFSTAPIDWRCPRKRIIVDALIEPENAPAMILTNYALSGGSSGLQRLDMALLIAGATLRQRPTTINKLPNIPPVGYEVTLAVGRVSNSPVRVSVTGNALNTGQPVRMLTAYNATANGYAYAAGYVAAREDGDLYLDFSVAGVDDATVQLGVHRIWM